MIKRSCSVYWWSSVDFLSAKANINISSHRFVQSKEKKHPPRHTKACAHTGTNLFRPTNCEESKRAAQAWSLELTMLTHYVGWLRDSLTRGKICLVKLAYVEWTKEKWHYNVVYGRRDEHIAFGGSTHNTCDDWAIMVYMRWIAHFS